MSVEGCLHRKRAKAADGSISCVQCGTVVIESHGLLDGVEESLGEDADSTRYLDLRHTRRLPLAPLSAPVRQLHELARALCHSLGLSSSLAERAIALVNVALERRLVNRGEMGKRAVGAAIYWLARGMQAHGEGDRPLPLTVRELASLLGVSQPDMASSLELTKGLVEETYGVQIAPMVDPSLYVEKLASALEHGGGAVARKAEALCNLCQERFSLTAGRRPEAIAMACLLIAGGGKMGSPGEGSSRRPGSWRQRAKVLCELVGLAPDTVIVRCNEIRDALVDEARRLPFGVPGGTRLKRETVDVLLDDILRHHQLDRDGRKAAPPSYEESAAKRRLRGEQVERALIRLRAPNAGCGAPATLTLEDVLIERLLLHQVSRDHIEQTTSLSQLLALEEACIAPEEDCTDGADPLLSGQEEAADL